MGVAILLLVIVDTALTGYLLARLRHVVTMVHDLRERAKDDA